MPNTSFLSLVAADLLKRFGKNLNQVTVIFPNKRASLFLNQELARINGAPVWAPRYTTMSDIFQRIAKLSRAESIDSVCTLYQVYCQELGEDCTETLDQFYAWGEMLLADFDDIDKHLANARSLFANIHDLQELSDLSYLTPEQEEALRNFFGHFKSEQHSELKSRFLKLWDHMYALYTGLQEAQQQHGVLYEGALFRSVVEACQNEETRQELFQSLPQHVVFAGFNVLNDVEEQLMLMLKNDGRAIFYWDYDVFYTRQQENEAGLFMRRNLSMLGSALPEEEFDNLGHQKDITLVSTNSDNAQARYATPWLQGELNPQESRNAIILCDEAQLLPLLHAIPEEGLSGHPKALNATMGFPLRDTPVFSFVTALVALQTEGYDILRKRFRRPLLLTLEKHPYYNLVEHEYAEKYIGTDNANLIHYLITLLRQVGCSFSAKENPDLYEQLYAEAVFQTHRMLQQLLALVTRTETPLQVESSTLRRLLRTMLAGVSIPFHGEPAMGIQVMGVLETRCLDFSHMLVLNLEEGKLPKTAHDSSLIPVTLREAFGLTTLRHKVAVYAYYFYRLIQRTEHLTCVYNENCTGNEHHEISRFLRQVLAETQLPVRQLRLAAEPQLPNPHFWSVPKTQEVMDILLHRYARKIGQKDNTKAMLISPTAINTYLDCPLRFYFRYVAQIKIQEGPEDSELLPMLGTIFHDTAELIYTHIINHKGNQNITKSDLAPWIAHPKELIGPMLDLLFDVHLFHPIENENERDLHLKQCITTGKWAHNEYYGEQIIYYNVLLKYLTNLLRFDQYHAPFKMLGMEVDRTLDLRLDTLHGPVEVRTGGRVDRIDCMEGMCRIVDYKTGNSHADGTPSIAHLFSSSTRRNGYCLQVMLYALAELMQSEPQMPVVPALFFTGKAQDSANYNPLLKLGRTPIEDFTDYAEEFCEGLIQVLTELMNPKIPFNQTEEKELCSYCPYKMLCR